MAELRSRSYSVLIFAVSMALSALAAFYSWRYFDHSGVNEFHRRATLIESAIDRRIQSYLSLLFDARAFFLSRPSVGAEDFERYTRAIDLDRRYPGAIAVGFARLVPDDRAEETLSRYWGSRAKTFKIWPPTAEKSSFPIILLGPREINNNERALGFDFFSETKRRAAIIQARDTGLPSVTGPVTLLQDVQEPQPKTKSFLIFLPVYEPDQPLETIEQRRAAFQGVLYTPFRGDDLFNTIFSEQAMAALGVDFELYAGPLRPENLIFDWDGIVHVTDEPRRFQEIRTLDVAGTPWTVGIAALSGFKTGAATVVPSLVLALGLIMSGLLLRLNWIAASVAQAQRRARRRFEFLDSATTQIYSRTLDEGEIVSQLGKAIVPQLGDFARLVIIDEKGQPRTIGIEASHPDPELQGKLSEADAVSSASTKGTPEVLKSGEPIFIPRVDEKSISKITTIPAVAKLILSLKARSIAIAPLRAHGRVLGTVSLMTAESGRTLSQEDFEILQELATRAGIAMENALLYRETQEAVQTRDDFISVASHELKTPLTTLKLQAQMIRQLVRRQNAKALTPEKLADLSETGEKQVDRLVNLVDDMLDVSRIRSGKLLLEPAPMDLSKLVQQIASESENLIQDSGSHVVIHAPVPVEGRWDHFRMEQVVFNLLSNALKYGEGKPVTIEVSKSAGQAVLKVQDQGGGIAAENHERIFRRFERATSGAHISGLGLGLYIVSQIVKNHGGEIRVESDLGKGSSFIVTLPLKPPPGDTPSTSN